MRLRRAPEAPHHADATHRFLQEDHKRFEELLLYSAETEAVDVKPYELF